MAAQLGPYAILETLGSGGMGAVYRARDARTGREVALKVMTPTDVRDAAERFARESRAAMSVRHPNVVPVHDAGVAAGRPYIAFALVPGGDLRRLLRERGRLPWREAVRFAREIAAALVAIHAVGLIHRDLKPANVLLGADGRALLTDFGLARSVTGSSLTATGEALGTPAYMSPEQADGRRAIDSRADLYGLGVILHEMLAGERPFQGDGLSLLRAHLLSPPRPLPPDVAIPADLAALLTRLLAKEPVARPRDAETVVEELAALEKADDAQKDAPPRQRAPLLIVGLGGVVVVAALIGTTIIERSGPPTPPVSPPPPPPPPVLQARSPAPSPPAPAPAPPPSPTAPLIRTSALAPKAIAAIASDPARALELAKAALDEAPDDPLAALAHAHALRAAGDIAALAEIKKAKARFDACVKQLIAKGRLDELVALSTRMLENEVSKDEMPPHLSWRAQAYLERGDDALALADLKSLLPIEGAGEHWWTELRQSVCFARSGKYQEAIQKMGASRAEPGPEDRSGSLGQVSARLVKSAQERLVANDWERAASAFIGAYETRVPPPVDQVLPVHALLVKALRENGASSKRALQILEVLVPDLASQLLDARRPRDAEAVIGPLLERFPDDCRLLSTLGAARIQAGRAADALAPLDRAIARAATYSEVWQANDLWAAYARRAQAKEARHDIAGAIRDDEWALGHCGDHAGEIRPHLDRLRALAAPK